MEKELAGPKLKRTMRVFLVFFLLVFNNFGGLTTLITKFYSFAVQMLLVGLWCFVFLFTLLVVGRKGKSFLGFLKNPQSYLPVIVIVTIVFIEIINSLVLGGRSFVDDIAKKSFYYLAIVAILPFSYLFSYFLENDRIFFIKSVLYFTIGLCALGIVQDLLILFSRGPLIIVTSYSFRNGLPRFVFPSSCNWIVLCYCYSTFLSRKKDFFIARVSCFFLIVLTDLFIAQTRGALISNFVLLFLLTIRHFMNIDEKTWSKIALIATSLIFSGVLVFGFLCYSNHAFLYSIFYPDLSVTTRIDGIRFFFSSFINFPIFGRGFLQDSTNSSASFFLYHGYEGSWIRIDDGIIGFLDLFGCLGIVFYFYLIFHYSLLVEKIRSVHSTTGDVCFSIIYFAIATIPSLCIFDYERFLLLCVCLSLIYSLANQLGILSFNHSYASLRI